MRNGSRLGQSALILVLGIASGVLPACTADTDEGSTQPIPVPGGEIEPYPEEWMTTLTDAKTSAAFPVIVPSDPNANPDNITAAYVWPDGSAVALRFPPPGPVASPVRQEYIEVWESPWAGGDPEADFKTDMAEAPSDAKSLYDIDGVVALGVTAHSAADIEGANPAFLRFVVSGVEVDVSGGESIDVLIAIAGTIVKAARSDTPAA
jgi:hypothetical protein